MEKKFLFLEIQKFNQWWLWLILLGTDIILIVGSYKVVSGPTWGANPVNNAIFLFIIILIILLSLIFLFCFRLITEINEEGIFVRFTPFHRNVKYFPWDTIETSEVVQYRPAEYGGWGVRMAYRKLAYTTSGNRGLQLQFKNGKKLLIGTNKPEELKKILETILSRRK